MASEKPSNELDMLTIQGISEVKMEKYGHDFLAAIRKFNESKLNTFEATYQLHQQGLSIDEICLQRELKIETIVSHLCKLHIEGKDVMLDKLISQSELAAVIKAHESINDSSSLKPYFEFLDEKLPYYKIRVALTILQKENSH